MARTQEQVREAKRRQMAQRRAADPEAARAYHRQRHHRNRDANCAKMRAYAARRFFWNRQMHLRGSDRATAKQLWALWHKQRGRCALTGRRLDRTAHLDHIIAKVRGGSDAIGNLRWLCRDVNMAKRELSDAQFQSICLDVMRWIGECIAAVDAIPKTGEVAA